jgi:uncharacterized protein YndB with AHSA1/START domain
MPERVEVSRTIQASPERLYDLVSDLPRMGEWSPENRGGRWVKGAKGPTVGARFKGKNTSGWKSWSTDVEVTVAEPGREFAFDVTALGMRVARWGYRFDGSGSSTTVTEYWEDHRSPFAARISGLLVGISDRATHNRAGMAQTLEKLATAAEG